MLGVGGCGFVSHLVSFTVSPYNTNQLEPPTPTRLFKAFRFLVRAVLPDSLTGSEIVLAQLESEPFKVGWVWVVC